MHIIRNLTLAAATYGQNELRLDKAIFIRNVTFYFAPENFVAGTYVSFHLSTLTKTAVATFLAPGVICAAYTQWTENMPITIPVNRWVESNNLFFGSKCTSAQTVSVDIECGESQDYHKKY